MKKNLLLTFAFLGLALCFSSCSSEYDANPVVNNSNIRNPMQGTFTAEVNGVPFVADEKTVFDTTINNTRTVSISGLAYAADKDPKKFQVIQLSIPDFTGTHPYTLDGYTSGQYIVTDSNYVQIFNSTVGDTMSNITITEAGSNWAGTFSFKVVPAGSNPNHDTITIASGNFSIPK